MLASKTIQGQQLFSIYPNPAKELLTIVPVRTMKADIQIFNALGAVMINLPGTDLSTGYQLDISHLAPGVYFISINANDGQTDPENGCRKIIKPVSTNRFCLYHRMIRRREQ